MRLVIGSWKIIATSVAAQRAHARLGQRERGRRVLAGAIDERGFAADDARPPARQQAASASRLVTDLPEPDSPTSAVVWPARIAKLTSATGVDHGLLGAEARCEVARRRERFVDGRSHSAFRSLRIEQVAHAVAQDLQRQRGER